MSILLALLGALSYGLSDFLGGVGSRRTSPWAVALVASVVAGLVVLAVSPLADGSPGATDLWWGVLAGVGNGVGTAFLYRGLSSGRMGVVAPVSAVGSAVVPVAAGLLGGERPGTLVWLGILTALPAIWLVAAEPAEPAEPARTAGPTEQDLPVAGQRRVSTGVADGVLAGLGFGTLFAALGQVPESAGLLPLAVNQLVGGLVIIAVAVALRQPWLPRERPAAIGAVCGVLGAVATGAFVLATQRGELTVTAVLASLYPAFTILLAAAVLHERVHRTQGVGLLLCGAAVTLVAVG